MHALILFFALIGGGHHSVMDAIRTVITQPAQGVQPADTAGASTAG